MAEREILSACMIPPVAAQEDCKLFPTLVPLISGKENAPPYNCPVYVSVPHPSVDVHKVFFDMIYQFMVDRKRPTDDMKSVPVNFFKALDRAVVHFQTGDVSEVMAAEGMGHLCQIYEETPPVASVEEIETLIDPMDIEMNMMIYSTTNMHELAWSYVKQGDLNRGVGSENDAKGDPPKTLPVTKPLDVDYYGGKANEMRIILLGRSGGGKSATANTILGSKEFESKVSGTSITSKCKFAIGKQFDRNFVLVDTPGLFDTGKTNEIVTREIVRCIGMTSPGPHAFLLVVTTARFTKEEQDTVQHFVKYFGEDLYKYLIVVFTRKDDLDADNTTIEEFIKMVPDYLKKTLQLCEQRYIAFNNRLQGDESKEQVQSLIDKIDGMIKSNGNRYFTNDLYHEVEKAMRNRHDELKRELDEKKNREIETMPNEFGKKIETDAAKSEETRKTNEIIKPTKPVTSTPLKKQFTERRSKTLEREVSDLKKELLSTRGRSDALTEILITTEEVFNRMEKKAAEENNKIEAGKNELAKKRELLKYERAEYKMKEEDIIKKKLAAQLEIERFEKTLRHKEQEINKKMIRMEPEGQNAEKDEQKFLQVERVADKEKELITRVKEGSLKAKSVREKIEMNKQIIETHNEIRNDETKALESKIFDLKKELISARERSDSNSETAIRIEEVLKAMAQELLEEKSKIKKEKKKLEQVRQLLEEEKEEFEMEVATNEIKLIAQLEEKRREMEIKYEIEEKQKRDTIRKEFEKRVAQLEEKRREIEIKYEIEEKQIRDTIRKEFEEYETTGTCAKDATAGTFAKDGKTGTFAKNEKTGTFAEDEKPGTFAKIFGRIIGLIRFNSN